MSAVERTHQILAHTCKAAENARHCRTDKVAQHGLVGVFSFGELNRAGEAVDLGPDHQWRRRRRRRRRFLRGALALRALGVHDGLEEELVVEFAEARLAEAHDTAAARGGLAVDRGHDDVERVLAVALELLESDGAAGGAGCRCLTVEALGLATATDLVDVLGCPASERASEPQRET